MIKGCHKSVVFLKDTGSELFDEAYFVVKPSAKQEGCRDIVTEAKEIASGFLPKKHKKHPWVPIVSFLLGGALGAGLVLFII